MVLIPFQIQKFLGWAEYSTEFFLIYSIIMFEKNLLLASNNFQSMYALSFNGKRPEYYFDFHFILSNKFNIILTKLWN